ncbi:MAG: LptF/LptG family permease, partial [Elusimicrobiota bacterium]
MLLYRYLSREFIKPLIFSTASFGGLVMISEFFRELNYYLEKKVNFIDVFAYLLCNLPWWCIQVLPVSVLLAVLFSLGDLARHNEITAVKASGVNLWKIILLFMLGGLLIGVSDFAVRELVIPHTVRLAEVIRDTRIHREDASD